MGALVRACLGAAASYVILGLPNARITCHAGQLQPLVSAMPIENLQFERSIGVDVDL